ncbi:SAM-dependent methyltransferase [Actinoallomurus sp. NPDC052274]|uniref:class I SAM-dependent methyltransferase n=1 Tax=Actinoallomurus sp. NPDC052274 TaxID=3155420 RepID=UPI00342F8C34
MIDNGRPSRTALMAAAARAAHLIVDSPPVIFADTVAYSLLGDQAEELVGYHRTKGAHPILAGVLATATVRSRYTEERLAEAVRRGVTQYVILGAGLDSYAYRADPADGVRVFEVDHPATQRWKRRLLAEAGVAIPDTVTYAPIDFETESLSEVLVREGLDASRPAFVNWLGVTMYLTPEAIGDTLAAVGRLAPGSEIVLDYTLVPELRDAAAQMYADAVSSMSAEQGEPWLSVFRPEEMSALLEERGFGLIEHSRHREAVDAALWERTDPLLPSNLSGLAHATVLARSPQPAR